MLGAIGGAYFVTKSRAETSTSNTTTTTTTALGDSGVTDSEALYPGDPVASDPAVTEATNNNSDTNVIAASVSCAQFTLNRIVHDTGGNNYDLNNNRYGGGDQCASNTDGGADFTVYDGGTPSSGGGVKAYPNLIRGCSTHSCYSNNWPKQVSSLGSWTADAAFAPNGASGHWLSGFDLWFNRSNSVGNSRGAEILVDFNRQNHSRPSGVHHIANVFGDSSYDLYYWRNTRTIDGTSYTWNFLHFWRNTELTSISNMSLNKFMDKANHVTCPNNAPCLRTSWYWTGIDTGVEIWSGGYGLNFHGVNIHS